MEVASIVSGILAAQDETKQLQISTTVLRDTAIAGKIAAEKAEPHPPILAPASATARRHRLVGAINPRRDLGVVEIIGAGEGNRTLVFSLEGCCSTIELHPRAGIT